MKSIKIVLATVLLLSVLNASSQKVILRAGVNLANVSNDEDGGIDDANSLTSFQAGLIFNLPVLPFFSIQPGIVFTGKGSKTESGSTSDNTYYRATSNPYYVEVPVNLVFKTPTGPIKFFAGAGPYIAIGVAGHKKTSGKFLGTSFSSETDIEWSNDDPTTLDYEEGSGFGILKRFDYGLNGLVGIEMKKAILSVNYGLGLAKLQSGTTSSDNDLNKHRVLSFTLGIKL